MVRAYFGTFLQLHSKNLVLATPAHALIGQGHHRYVLDDAVYNLTLIMRGHILREG